MQTIQNLVVTDSGKETKNLTYTFTAFVLIRGDVNGKDACGELPKAALCCHFSPVAFDTFSQLIISND